MTLKLFLKCIWVFYFAFTYVCALYNEPGAHRGQKRALHPLELELQISVNLHKMFRIELRSSGRVDSVLKS